MDLKTYTETERGAAARLARALKVPPVLISQWAAGTRPIPEDRAPAIEAETDFQVTAETSCPAARWVRVPDEHWPNGKPLLDKTPERADAPATTPVDEPSERAAASNERRMAYAVDAKPNHTNRERG